MSIPPQQSQVSCFSSIWSLMFWKVPPLSFEYQHLFVYEGVSLFSFQLDLSFLKRAWGQHGILGIGRGQETVKCFVFLLFLKTETLIWNTNWDTVPGLFQSFSRCKRFTLWWQKCFAKGISGHRKIKLLYTETFLSKHLRSFYFATVSSRFLKTSWQLLQ